MDPIGVLPDAHILSNCKYSLEVKKRGISSLGELAKFLLVMPYGFPDSEDLLESLEKNYGTCVQKHGIYAGVAHENGIDVKKCYGFYKLDSKIVPGIEPILKKHNLDWIPAAHCFLSYGLYRVDLTEGNCNGKETSLDSYLKIHQIPFDLNTNESNLLYRQFLEVDFKNWYKSPFEKTTAQWEALYTECSSKLKLGISCSIG